MNDAQSAVDAAHREVGRLITILRRSQSLQVRNDDEKRVVKSTALAWFNSHRPKLCPPLDAARLASVDERCQRLISAGNVAASRSKVIASARGLQKALAALQTEQALALSMPSAPTSSPSADDPPSFHTLIADPAMVAILDARWRECAACIRAGAPLAATVMMGGMIEGLLLARINQLDDKSAIFRASSSPKDRSGVTLKLQEWTLKNYIDVAHEMTWISQTAKDIGVVIRDYRNYIHPQKELSHGLVLSAQDAKMLWEIAKRVIRQLL